MKKIIFLFLALLLSGGHILAQLENRFSIGPRIGANFSNVNRDNTDNLTGIVAGLTSTYSINENSGITLDLLYSAEGYKVGNVDMKINYIRIPLLYDVFFGKLGEAFRPKVYIGIAPGFLASAKANQNDIANQNNDLVLDLVGGLGFNYRVGSRIWLNADLRAFLGMSNIEKSGNSKNRTIQPSLGIAYGI